MKDKTLIIIGAILLIASIVIANGSISIRDFTVTETSMDNQTGDYLVTVGNYSGYTMVFTPEEYNELEFNIKEEITRKLNIFDSIEDYDSNGCSTDQDCYDAGFTSLDNSCETTGICRTVCYRNYCIDWDKTEQIDKKLDGYNPSKKEELDNILIAK